MELILTVIFWIFAASFLIGLVAEGFLSFFTYVIELGVNVLAGAIAGLLVYWIIPNANFWICIQILGLVGGIFCCWMWIAKKDNPISIAIFEGGSRY
jgi:hypothetical protein